MLMNVKFGMNVIKIVKIQLDRKCKMIHYMELFISHVDMYVLVEQIIHLKLTIDANILIVNPSSQTI